MITKSIRVNEKDILILTEGNEKYVAIKPICQALKISHKVQMEKIKADETLSKIWRLKKAVSSDNKRYNMFCIPFEYVQVWLVSVNPRNVMERAKGNVLKNKDATYSDLISIFKKDSSKEQSVSKIITEQETHKKLDAEMINRSVVNLTNELNLSGGSNGTIQLYRLLQEYLLNPQKRHAVNKLLKI